MIENVNRNVSNQVARPSYFAVATRGNQGTYKEGIGTALGALAYGDEHLFSHKNKTYTTSVRKLLEERYPEHTFTQGVDTFGNQYIHVAGTDYPCTTCTQSKEDYEAKKEAIRQRRAELGLEN